MKVNYKKDSIKYLLKLFLITRIILVIFMIVFNVLLSNNELSMYNYVLDLFDNEHYLNIAKYGYVYSYQYAFFPLTPLLIRYLGKSAFLVLNQVFVLLSGYLLYLISDKIYKNENTYFASTLWFISPISVFTCMFYSESLFIFFTILAFYLYKTKKNYFALGITLGLSVLTRSLGSMLFFTIFIFMFIDFIKRRLNLKYILTTYIPATIISSLYPLFLYVKTGDFLFFMNIQFTYWHRIKSNIFTFLIDSGKLIFNSHDFLLMFEYIIIAFLICYIFYVIIIGKKEKKYYEIFLYMFLSIVAICSTTRNNCIALASVYRYIFGCFPIYFMIKPGFWSFILVLTFTLFVTSLFLLGIHFY